MTRTDNYLWYWLFLKTNSFSEWFNKLSNFQFWVVSLATWWKTMPLPALTFMFPPQDKDDSNKLTLPTLLQHAW